ncbi:MAG: hypothetical protein [Bacteriophage sp.]|nr:MAG: hypothetical protein [Bacteriophage sp.]
MLQLNNKTQKDLDFEKEVFKDCEKWENRELGATEKYAAVRSVTSKGRINLKNEIRLNN